MLISEVFYEGDPRGDLERAADGGVGVGDDVAGGVVGQPDWQRGDQLAAAGPWR